MASCLGVRVAGVGSLAFGLWAAPTDDIALPHGHGSAGGKSVDPVDAAIQNQPICVGSTTTSAGELGSTLLYRRGRGADGRLAVGYYVFYTDERPWGDNWLSWSLVPALALDLVYTRLFFAFPGVRRLRFGPGDVEGFRVMYDVVDGFVLSAAYATADDNLHAPRYLARADLFAVDPHRMVLVTDSWSHHLGARSLRQTPLASLRCYGAGAIQPLPEEVIQRFALGKRARPAAL